MAYQRRELYRSVAAHPMAIDGPSFERTLPCVSSSSMSQTSLRAVGCRKSRSKISSHVAHAVPSTTPYYASSEPWSRKRRGPRARRAETPAADVTARCSMSY